MRKSQKSAGLGSDDAVFDVLRARVRAGIGAVLSWTKGVVVEVSRPSGVLQKGCSRLHAASRSLNRWRSPTYVPTASSGYPTISAES
jgi:hypothetical protein